MAITNSEINKIKSLKNYKYEKVLFVMIYLSKAFHDDRYPNRYFVNHNFTEILKLSKVYASSAESKKIRSDLCQLGFIIAKGTYADHSNGKDNFEILCIDNNSEAFVNDNTFINIISLYPSFCISCGKIMNKKSNRQTLCNDCWQEKRRKDVKNNVKRYRNNNVIS